MRLAQDRWEPRLQAVLGTRDDAGMVGNHVQHAWSSPTSFVEQKPLPRHCAQQMQEGSRGCRRAAVDATPPLVIPGLITARHNQGGWNGSWQIPVGLLLSPAPSSPLGVFLCIFKLVFPPVTARRNFPCRAGNMKTSPDLGVVQSQPRSPPLLVLQQQSLG